MSDPARSTSAVHAGVRVGCVLAFGLVASISGCKTTNPRVSLAPPRARYDHDDYSKVLQRWTRKARIIRELDTPLRVQATLVSPDYGAAYVALYTHMFQLPAAKRRELAAKMAREWESGFRLVIVATAHDYSWNDFHRKDSIWRVTLVTDGQREVEPVEVKREKRLTPTLRTLYPHVVAFSQLYQIRFPKTLPNGSALVTDRTRRVILRIAGPLGRADLTWQLSE